MNYYCIILFSISDSFKFYASDLPIEAVDDSKRDVCLDTVYKLNASEEVSEEMLHIIAQLPDASSSGHFYTVLNESLMKMERNIMLALLDVDSEALTIAFEAIHKENCSPKVHISVLRPSHE